MSQRRPGGGARAAPQSGKVVAFDAHRGLGEVETAAGARLPFHCAQIADGTRQVAVGAAVEFDVAPGLLGRWEAVALRPAS